jgi:hypothetical protein
MRANSRARASIIAGVTVPMPSAFSIMMPLFSGFLLIFQSLLIHIDPELPDERLGERDREGHL